MSAHLQGSGIRIRAVVYMVLSALSFTGMNTVVKHVQYLSVFQIIFFRAVTSLILVGMVMRYLRISPIGKKNKLLIIRSLFGLIAMIFFFWGVKLLPIGIAVSIRYLSPIFAAIFAIIILKEKMKKVQWWFIVIAFAGVLVIKDLGGMISGLGLLITIVSAIFSGLVYGMISLIGNRDHYLVIVFYFMATCTIVGGIVSLFVWQNPHLSDWLPLLMMGVFGFFGQIFMTQALQMEDASRIVPLKYSEVIFTLFSGIIFFSDNYNFFSLLGIFLIISALVGNLLVRKSVP